MTSGSMRREHKCRLCAGRNLSLVKEGVGLEELSNSDFMISDARYGVTLPVYLCESCGLFQCLDIDDALSFYQGMSDPGYEATREPRKLQERALLETIVEKTSLSPKGVKLLDVGAGSGILVEEAGRMGFDAEGVEPSALLAGTAKSLGLNVREGTLEDIPPSGEYRVITMIDVIEHVTNPVELLSQAMERLAPGGALALVTPDVNSFAARVMGWRWWHYRIAHLSYFSSDTLKMLYEKAGLRLIYKTRPGWVFTTGYLMERLAGYMPMKPRVSLPGFLGEIKVPLNLYDSLMVILERNERESKQAG